MNIIKKIIYNVIKPLTYISSKSYKECSFPDSIKISKAILFLKSGDKNILGNYRPI